MKTAVVWFRRDLRVHDNPALAAAACAADRVVPVFVWSPDEEAPWAPGAASRWWLHHSLAALDGALRRLGAPLVIRRGPSPAALLGVAREAGADAVYWNDLPEPAARARDRRVQDALAAAGLRAATFNAAVLLEPDEVRTAEGRPYRVFTPFWRAVAPRIWSVEPRPAPRRLAGVALPGESPAALGLLPQVRWDGGLAESWQPGEAGALEALDEFCDGALGSYPAGRDQPGRTGTSRLSPHLHFGEIGPRQLVARVAALQASGRSAGTEAFLRELGWREFGHHLLRHFPHTAEAPLDARFARFPWRSDPDALARWQRGRTGFPLVDAGLRELWHTGWMHNRVRMVVASFLAKNLLLPWQEGARWFWDTLVDADLAGNTLGWQWTAGCGADAAPYFRIFNPLSQAQRFDPAGAYLRRWLPELADLPDAALHDPTAAQRAARGYPAPVVDLAASRARALAAYGRMREAAAGLEPSVR